MGCQRAGFRQEIDSAQRQTAWCHVLVFSLTEVFGWMWPVRDVEELLLAMQAKLSQCLSSRATPEAVELLPVDPKGVPEIATPVHYVLENIMKITQFSVVAHRNQAGDHRAYVAQNSSQNQSFERDRSRHPSSLRYSPTPDFLTLSKLSQRTDN